MNVERLANPRLVIIALIAALTIPFARAADPFVQTRVETNANARADVSGPSETSFDADASDLGAIVEASAFAQKNPATASADATTSLGFLHAQAFGSFPSTFADSDAKASALGMWTDSFLIDIAGHSGEVAQLSASVLVDGFADVVGDGRAELALIASRNTFHVGSVIDVFLESGPVVGPGAGGFRPVLDLSFPFIVGTPFQFMLSLSVEAERAGIGAGAADINFFNTVVWNGISEVTIGGNSVSVYAFSSLSGLDYRESFAVVEPPTAAVPEPASALLVLIGLALLWRREATVDARIAQAGGRVSRPKSIAYTSAVFS